MVQETVNCWIESKKRLRIAARELRLDATPENARYFEEAEEIERHARDALIMRVSGLLTPERIAIMADAYRRVRIWEDTGTDPGAAIIGK